MAVRSLPNGRKGHMDSSKQTMLTILAFVAIFLLLNALFPGMMVTCIFATIVCVSMASFLAQCERHFKEGIEKGV